MEHLGENILDIVQEELLRLGVQVGDLDIPKEVKKFGFYQNGSKRLGLAASNALKFKLGGFYDSPRNDKKTDCGDSTWTSKMENKKKISRCNPSSKNKLDQRMVRKSKSTTPRKFDKSKVVFGCDLDSIELFSTSLHDGTIVSVPEFVVDASNIIRKNITIEGIFRKAGSTYRQNELKKLLNTGHALPTSAHPIDVACLLKHFLRSLKKPLFSHYIHFLMTRCLELPKEEQQEALSLCSLLLAKSHQDLLAYILELFSYVAASSHVNLMDAHNLAVVFAPNLLPSSPMEFSGGKKGFWTSDDHLLSSTIDVIQLLIEGASGMCRLSQKLCVAVRNREKSQSMECLDNIQTSGNPKKKRRSASIHRLVNGLRRVVQAGGLLSSQASSAAPTVNVQSPPVIQDRSLSVSMDPDVDTVSLEKPGKRKSDSFETLKDREEMMAECHPEFDRPTKKQKCESKFHVHPRVAIPLPEATDGNRGKHPKTFKSLVAVRDKTSENVKRTYSLRDRKDVRNSNSPSIRRDFSERKKNNSSINSNKQSFIEGRSREIYSIGGRRTFSPTVIRKGSFQSPRRGYQYRKATTSGSKAFHKDPDPGKNEKEIQCKGQLRPARRESFKFNSPPPDPIDDLEKQYDKIKCVVQSMEEEVDRNNLKDLKENYFADQSTPEFSSMSCSQLIHDAYEKMKLETRDLDCSPAENLSRRLGRELKIRNRKSDQHRVMRSPSERRIGTIRRRSKELEQNTPKAPLVNGTLATPSKTPKLKGTLFQSPQTCLKRGKPNSLKSGLPVVLKPLLPNSSSNPKDFSFVSPRRICLSKRRLSSQASLEDADSSKENLMNAANVHYSGPITRRRSSYLSSLSYLISNSAESSYNSLKSVEDRESQIAQNYGAEFEERPSFVKGCTMLLSSSGRDLSGCDSDWIPATKFLKEMKDEQVKSKVKCSTPHVEENGNRHSIAALKKQKKVTANVQLFSQLQDTKFDVSSRRSFIHKKTPPNAHHTPLRSVYSERRGSRASPGNISFAFSHQNFRCVTQSHHANGINTFQSPEPITPVLTNERFNPNSTPLSTPRIMSKGSRGSRIKRMDTFIIPQGMELLPPRPVKPCHLTPKNLEWPPQIPPRSGHLYKKEPTSPLFSLK